MKLTNTYLTGSNYTSRYIFNRLLTSTVTDGTHSTTLATNVYDNASNSYCTGGYSLTNVSANEHDNTNYGTGFAYRGNPAAVVTPSGTRCISYDITGNVVTHNNNGLTTSVTTTNNFAVPATITTNSLSSSMSWQPFLGLASATGANTGDTQSIAYDSNARPQTSTSSMGATTTYTYNDSASPPTTVATTNGHWVRTTMEGFGRTIKTETGNGTTVVSVVDTTYYPAGCEPLGKINAKSQAHAPGGTLYWTTYTYDGLGRTAKVLAPDGASAKTYSYSGNTVTVTDPAGKTKTFTRDAFGNLTKVQEPDPALGTVTTTYTYDILNHLTGVSMPRGSNTQTRTFNYTGGSTVGIDLLSATNPENGTVTYTYNSDHTLATKTDAKNQTFTYQYDSYKRVTQVSVGGSVVRTFMYDTNTLDGSFSGSSTKGRLVAVQNTQFNAPGTGAVTAIQFTEMYAYKVSGLVSGKRLQVNETLTGGTMKTLNLDAIYTYDIEGKTTSVNYPTTYAWNGSSLVATSGPTYTYSFDAMDRATGLKDQNNNTAVSGVQYNAANQYLAINYFGSSETRTYNIMNQMTRLTIPGSLDISYTFSNTANDGKITGQTDNISGETVTYQYDSLKRLIAATGSGWSETYGYDAFGNLVSKTPTGTAPTLSIAVNPATNQVVGQSYDANGNQTSVPGQAGVTYDAENRLSIAPGIQYAYDSTNKRIWRGYVGNGNLVSQEVYLYGLGSQKLGTYALTANAGATPYLADSTTNLAVFFRSKRIGITTNGTTTAFIQNRLGSQGNYYPYGEARGTVPYDAVGFATYTLDATLLNYADQRYYFNNFGRFMTPDPYKQSGGPSDPGSWNRYSYGMGDPTNGNDPAGLLTLVINGAFDDSPDWMDPSTQAGASFLGDVKGTFGESATPWRWSGIGVTAVTGYGGIIAAGVSLEEYINSYQFKPGEPLNIVAFSDGGNVSKVAIGLGLNHVVNNLVTLGTPQNWDLTPPPYDPYAGSVNNVCSVSSLADWVQVAGSSPGQLYNLAGWAYQGAQDSAAAWDAWINDEFALAAGYWADAAFDFGQAAGWFLTTKIDPWANNVLLAAESHFDLHTASVWNKIKGSCGLTK